MIASIPRLFLFAVLLAGAVVVGAHWPDVEAWFAAAGTGGAVVYAGGFLVMAVGCFPVSVLGVTAGALYGPWFGLLVALPAGVLAGLAMFFLGRSLLRAPIQRRVAANPRLRAFDGLVARSAVRINLLSRLSPFNYGLVCYTLAVGPTSRRAYVIGLVGVLPGMVGQVWIGALVRTTGRSLRTGAGPNTVELGLTAAGIIALALLGWQVGRLARQAWREVAARDDHDTPHNG